MAGASMTIVAQRFAASLNIAFIALWTTKAEALLFVIDDSASSVQITDSATGWACYLTNCGIEAQIASGLSGTTFNLQTGDMETFDFLAFTGAGYGATIYNTVATLAFTTPTGANTTGSGGGFAILFGGFIKAGVLAWNNLPQTHVLADGSIVSVDFQGGKGILLGYSVTTSATVKGNHIAAPEPAMLALFGSGLLGLAFILRWRRPLRSALKSRKNSS